MPAPPHLRDYIDILNRKFTDGGEPMDMLDARRYSKVIEGLEPREVETITEVMDQTYRYRPDVAQVAEIRDRLFPGRGRRLGETLPPAQAAIYRAIAPPEPIPGQRLLESGPVSEAGLERLREMTRQLEEKMDPKHKRILGSLREERKKATEQKNRGQWQTGEKFTFNEEAARKKIEVMKAQTKMIERQLSGSVQLDAVSEEEG